MHNAFIAIAGLFFLGHGLQWFFGKTKISDVLILIAVGYLIGPGLNLIAISDLGRTGPFLTTLALVVILYHGGVRLHASELLSSSLPALGLAVIGFLFMFGIGMLSTMIFLPLPVAILIGLGIGSTSSAVVVPMVSKLRVTEKTRGVLSLESAFNDVLVIVTFLVAVEALSAGKMNVRDVVEGIGPRTLEAILIGLGGGLLWAFLDRNFEFITNKTFAAEVWACMVYGLMELTGYNGSLGVLALGFTLGNLELFPNWVKPVFSQKPVTAKQLALLEEIVFLLKTYFFIFLGMMIQPFQWRVIALASMISVLIFVARYIMVVLLIRSSKYPRIDAMVITAMGPRGLVCAVVAAIPLQRGIAGGIWIQEVLYSVIPISIIMTTVFVFLSERSWFRLRMGRFFGHYRESFGLAETAESPWGEELVSDQELSQIPKEVLSRIPAEVLNRVPGQVAVHTSAPSQEPNETTLQIHVPEPPKIETPTEDSYNDFGLVRLDEDETQKKEPTMGTPFENEKIGMEDYPEDLVNENLKRK